MRPVSEPLLDTIAALATPAGRSAIAVVRLSGVDTRAILARVAPELPDSAEPRRAYLTALVDSGGEPIDRGIVTLFSAPASFTGEDSAEISIHGSPVVVERVLRALAAVGARPARAGEFTERAFRLGKMDLVEAEAIRDLIDARTEAAARASARRVAGGLSSRLAEAREDLLASAAALAATIDFSEDVGEELDPSALSRLRRAQATLDAVAATFDRGRLLSAGSRVAILGRPNAGKSTLFNALLGTARAIVTEVPGTTRDALHASVDVGGIPVELVDTAGLRDTDDRVERIGVERAREEAADAAAVLYVFDVSAGWDASDAAALEALAGKPRTIVANKIDRIGRDREEAALRDAPADAVPVCGLSPDAGARLTELLERMVAGDVSTDASSDVLGSVRQRDLVARAGAAAAAALEALGGRVSHEYVATHVDSALAALADLFGETTAEDVIGRIFSTFCIGK